MPSPRASKSTPSAEEARLLEENACLRDEVETLRREIAADRQARFAALNLMEDATRAEAALRESEERMRLAIEAAELATWDWELEPDVVHWNEHHFLVLGLEPASNPQPASVFFERVHPEDRDPLSAHLQACIATRAVFDADFRIVLPDGEERWMSGYGKVTAESVGRATRMGGVMFDITDRQVAMAKVRTSEERYRTLFEAMDEGFCVFEMIYDEAGCPVDYRFIEVNPGFEKHTGLADARGRTILEMVPNHEPHWFETYGKVAATGVPTRFVARGEGMQRWFDVYAFRMGRPEDRRVAAIFTDITERTRYDDALRRSETYLASIFARAAVGISEIAPDGRFLRVNDTLCRMLGRTEEEILASKVEDVTHPDDYPKSVECLRRAKDFGESTTGDKRYLRPDGTQIWANSVASRLEHEDGREPTVLVVTVDLTERRTAEEAMRKSEETLRLIFESAREYAIFTTDLAMNVTKWNAGAERLLGFSEDEIVGRPADIIFTEEDRAAGRPAEERALVLNEGRASDERWHQRKDGSRFWSNGFLMPLHADGDVVGFVKILRDNTAAQKAREALEESQERLLQALHANEQARAEVEAAMQAKNHFLAVLSHELRTPLTPVLMAVEALGFRKDLPENLRGTLDMIHRNIRIEAHFIDDLLDLTRIDRGKLEVEHEPMDAHEAIRSAIEISRPDIEAKQQRLEVEWGAANTGLSGDSARIQQVVWNLLKNASKFTPVGGRITLATRNEDRWLCITVHDSGIGIDPSMAERIFDPFAQAGKDIARKYGGLGLGLAISKAAVEAHGGRIHVRSEGKDRGATFLVELPQMGHSNPENA